MLEALFTKLDFNDEGIFVHFAKNRPPNPEIPFVGIQPLLIKGLTSDFTYDASIKVPFPSPLISLGSPNLPFILAVAQAHRAPAS